MKTEKFTPVITKAGKKSSTMIVVDGVQINKNVYMMEDGQGNRVPPVTYSAYLDFFKNEFVHLHAAGDLPESIRSSALTPKVFVALKNKAEANFPEFAYCNGDWKLMRFLQVYLPSFKQKVNGRSGNDNMGDDDDDEGDDDDENDEGSAASLGKGKGKRVKKAAQKSTTLFQIVAFAL